MAEKLYKVEVTFTTRAVAYVTAFNKQEAFELIQKHQYDDLMSEEMLDDTIVIDKDSVEWEKA